MRRHGFTFIELLVALAVLAIVVSQLFVVFATQKRAYVTNERILDVQEDARLVMDLVVGETRMAGYMVPREAGIATSDGATFLPADPNTADTLCISDPSVLDDTVVRGANDRFSAASITAFVGNDRVQLPNLPEFDIDGSGGSDFGVGQGIIISDGTTQYCGRITAQTAGTSNQIEFTPDLPTVSLATTDFTVGSVRVVPAVVYEVGAGGLRRNNMLMSDEVEDLQIEYGLDINGDDVVDTADPNEFPIDSLVGSDPAQIRSVRITVTTRTSQQDPEFNGPGYEAVANRPSTANDGRRRRRFVASVLPRNLL